MNRFIINADDCGKSIEVNLAIKNCIEAGLITSTTIMANMGDFDGALSLYHDYSDRISFGFHLNLDEGEPIIKNDLLVERGFYKIEKGKMVMAVPNFRKPIDKNIRDAIYHEMEAQITKLFDNGIEVSHIDSHHHLHTSPFILPLVAKLAKKYGIKYIRSIRNYYPMSFNKCLKFGWKVYASLLYSGCGMTQYFCSATEYVQSDFRVQDKLIELMCHPGHPKKMFVEEINLLESFINNHHSEIELVSYRDGFQ